METIKVMRDGVEVEVNVLDLVKDSEDFKKALQSEASKAKGEILKAIGASSVDEAKTKMGAQDQVTKLAEELRKLSAENAQTRNKLYATELGVKPELVDKVIILANAAMEEGKDFKDVMRAEAEAIGALTTQERKERQQQGVPKSKEQIDLEKQEREEMKRLAELDPYNR